MENNEKLAMIEDCMDLERDTLHMDDLLSDYEEWDSLTELSIIAMAGEKYNKVLTGDMLKNAKLVSDVVAMLG